MKMNMSLQHCILPCVFMSWVLYAALFSAAQAGYKRTEKIQRKVARMLQRDRIVSI